MNLTIGTKTIEITSCTRKRDTQKGFFLEMVIPKENIGMDELYALLDDNAESIVVTEADGTVNTYNGFKEIGSFSCEKGVYRVAQVCTSEIEAQLSLAQNKVAEQGRVIEAMQALIDSQNQALEAHAQVISAQAEQIEAQTETIEAQAEEVAVLNDTLLEMLMA